jgi:hypothetical protein
MTRRLGSGDDQADVALQRPQLPERVCRTASCSQPANGSVFKNHRRAADRPLASVVVDALARLEVVVLEAAAVVREGAGYHGTSTVVLKVRRAPASSVNAIVKSSCCKEVTNGTGPNNR